MLHMALARSSFNVADRHDVAELGRGRRKRAGRVSLAWSVLQTYELIAWKFHTKNTLPW